MGDDIEFTKLPLEECCTHKLWKARLHGYTEVAKLFKAADDEKAPVFSQFVGLMSKFVGDSNAVAQEKGLEAVLLFVQNAAIAGKTAKEVMSVIVSKSIAAPKAKTKELSVQIALTYIEIEKQEQVVEELLKGLEHKNPKIVAACVSAITQSLREFGSKAVGIKPFVKFIGPLFEDRDKNVRDEAKAMVVEIYRWIKDGIKPQLTSLKPVHMSELEDEFEKVKGEKAAPTRLLRSQQAQQAKLATEEEENGATCESADVDDEGGSADPYDLMDPINILSQIPNDFYAKLEAKKWQERKEAVDALEKILEYPKFEKGDYADLVRALLKVISKDSNVIVVGIAVKCIGRLALGLKKGFQPYSGTVLPNLLEKFKEKKANVVGPLREAVDAIYPVTTLEAMQEDLVNALENKNPAVKAETASFLARCLSKCTPTILNKKLLKTFTAALLKTLNESDPTVRDNSAEALGTAMKVVGEKVITQFMSDVDNIKLNKIKECCEKAVVVKPQPVATKPAAAAATAAKAERSKSELSVAKGAGRAGQGAKKVSSASSVKKAASAPAKSSNQADRDRELTEEEVEERILEMVPEEILKGLVDPSWKVRLDCTESFSNTLKSIEDKDFAAQVLVRALAKKPGLKDTNFQVLKLKLEALKFIIENFALSQIIVDIVLTDVSDKLGDPKNGGLAAEILTSLAQATDLGTVADQVLEFAFGQKSPKVQQEALNWVAEAVKEFECAVQAKPLLENIRKGLNATNASVRTSAISLCGILYMYLGGQFSGLLDEKPAVMALLQAEFEKHEGEKPPPSTRISRRSHDLGGGEGGSESDAAAEEKAPETISRIDISSKLTDQLIAELGDKNWKTRNEALNALLNIVSDAKCIKSNLGELPAVLCQRLVDSNGKLALLALDICKSIAVAMGAQCRIHMKTFFRGFLSALGDSKQWVRSAALACINTWGSEGGFKEYFEGETIPDALKTGSPTLRTELWTWLADLLPNAKGLPKEDMILSVPYLYLSLEDRNSDVRKSAQSAVLPIMMHVGYGNMMKQTEKLAAGSKSKIMAVLEKIRPELPAQTETVKAGKGKKAEEKGKPEARTTPKLKGPPSAKQTTRRKEEEIDVTPLLPVNNMKNQRLIDEQKLKTLKWNFTMPRSEFVDLLREQMAAAGFNKTLVVNMFHPDFKFHLRAIDSLSEDIGNVDALTSNLDLILKWMTLRFFDTNPSVLLKGLEYLQNVFSLLIDNSYTVFDIEANSFIPYLVIKLGDPKDAVRDRVRAIIKQLSQMYPPGKLFVLIMEGLKSKNARQRAECLEELGNLIEEFGMSVCQPTPSSTLKEISKQISDRDNAVRSAALNAIVKAWFIEGDKVYKLIGQLSEKDMSLLEERVKRASKGRPPPGLAPRVDAKEKERSPDKNASAPAAEAPEEEADESASHPGQKQRQAHPGANVFKDLDLVAEPPLKKIDLIEIDVSFLDSPIQIPERIAAKLNKSGPAPAFQPKDLLIEQVIREVGSPNIEVAFQAATKLRLIFASHERNTLLVFADSIMDSFITQLKLINSYSLEKYGLILQKTYAILFRIIDDIFGKKTAMAEEIKVNHLQMLIQELLLTLIEDKTSKFAEGGYNRLISAFVSRIIENSNHTNMTCAMIKLLFDVVANPPSNPKITNSSTKCFVKIIILIRQGSSNWLGSLDLDEVLYECHLFFQAYPRHTWKDMPSQGPQKAIKTLLLVLVSLKGKNIFSHMRKIENPCASELAMFLKRLLKIQPSVRAGSNSGRLSKAMSEHLSDIFMKIANEETAKEGLLQFYEFKKQYPNLDLSSFLAPTSKYFQDYVENGLRNIERERGSLKPSPKKAPDAQPITSGGGCAAEGIPDISKDSGAGLAQYYLDKLRDIQARIGIHLSDLPDFKNENQS